jgi:hypothetical protein
MLDKNKHDNMTNTPSSPPAEVVPIDPIHFGIEVQSLATSIEHVQDSDRLSQTQMDAARNIASLFASNRDTLMQEFTGPARPSAEDLFGFNVNDRPDFTLESSERRTRETSKRELGSTAEEIDHDEATRLAIGEFLRTLPTKGRRAIDANTVIEAMFGYDLSKIAFTDRDYALVDEMLSHEQELANKKEALERALEDPISTQFVAGNILQFLVNAGEPITKVRLRTSDDFRNLMRQKFEGISRESIDTLFHSGWSYMEEIFADIDPTYKVFTTKGVKRGFTYEVNDPELVTTLWEDEHELLSSDTEQELPNHQEDTSKSPVSSFNGITIRREDGSETQVENPQVGVEFVDKLRQERDKNGQKIRSNAWFSRARLAQEIATKLGLKKEHVEQQLKGIISQLGSDMITSSYSRKGNRVLITKGPRWR